jgi:hypothetical protein
MSGSAATASSISGGKDRNSGCRQSGLHAASTAPLITFSAANNVVVPAVAFVVVGDPLDIAEPHGPHRLGALQRLTRALLVHAYDPRVARWAQVQASSNFQISTRQNGPRRAIPPSVIPEYMRRAEMDSKLLAPTPDLSHALGLL